MECARWEEGGGGGGGAGGGFGGRGQPDEAEGDPLEGAHPEVHTEEGGGLGHWGKD